MHKMTRNHDALSEVVLPENENAVANLLPLIPISAPADLNGWMLTPAQRIFIESLQQGLDSPGYR